MTSIYTQLTKNLEYLKLKQMITHLDEVVDFIKKTKEENELLKEEIKELRKSIESAYYTLISLESITKHEINDLENDIEEI